LLTASAGADPALHPVPVFYVSSVTIEIVGLHCILSVLRLALLYGIISHKKRPNPPFITVGKRMQGLKFSSGIDDTVIKAKVFIPPSQYLSARDRHECVDRGPKKENNSPEMEHLMPRPDYTNLWASYYRAKAEIIDTLVPESSVEAWVNVMVHFEDAMLKLLPVSPSGKVILRPEDMQTEHARVVKAEDTLRDWFKLYKEVLHQQPPETLQTIERELCQRRAYLDKLYPPNSRNTPRR
jgi:hypothetical protein